ncbi:hypothetical protein NKR19_g4105 [Coniochaeta hoffmannii]|uniref:Heterokaryon incompatibility domain-containing protein n=1 Tax=Coniochaeta hoffmannii TaxID=91930 RepID=A0AA38RRJ7_9PEZI|nr:hypothetical protein NKR19_g4105 [Coniochaeta hoffmannii]
MATAYKYQVLPSETAFFRLIQLFPSEAPEDDDDRSPLRCEIITAELGALGHPPTTSYEAISYVWGDKKPSSQYLLHVVDGNGTESSLEVSQTCHDALRRFRWAKPEPRTLWIDYICINQSDLQEKANQVSRMGTIYSKASRVLVWLGPDVDSGATLIIKMLEDCAAAYSAEKGLDEDRTLEIRSSIQDGKHINFKHHAADRRPSGCRVVYDINHLGHGQADESHSDAVERNMGIDEQDDDSYRASVFGQLLGLPWFHRMWTIQELALSTRATLIWGGSEINWALLLNAMPALRHVCRSGWLLAQSIVQIHQDIRIHILVQRHPEERARVLSGRTPTSRGLVPWSLIFTALRIKDASDPRDKIFAMYEVCTELGMPMPKPDYTTAVRDVFILGTRAMLREKNNPSVELVLFYLLTTPEPSTLPSLRCLPSWVPDWTQSWMDRQVRQFMFEWTFFRAAGESGAQCSWGEDLEVLVCRGRVIDTITVAPEGVMPTRKLSALVFDQAKRLSQPYDLSECELCRGWSIMKSWARLINSSEEGKPCPGQTETPASGHLDLQGDKAPSILHDFYTTLFMDIARPGSQRAPNSRESWMDDDECQASFKAFMRWYASMISIPQHDDGTNSTVLERTALEISDILAVPAHRHDSQAPDMSGHTDPDHSKHPKMDCDMMRFLTSVWKQLAARSFFTTTEDRMGVVDGQAVLGDVVVLVAGCNAVMILRSQGPRYRVVGTGYVHGVMDGEVWPGDDELESLEIV